VITAIVNVHCDGRRIPEVAQTLAELDGVSEVYSVTGDVDLVVMVRVQEHDKLADVIAGGIARVEGVVSTTTNIAFRAYSKHDLETAFALGFD
jgi:DNA-binding Lrp family transcriptional regulator